MHGVHCHVSTGNIVHSSWNVGELAPKHLPPLMISLDCKLNANNYTNSNALYKQNPPIINTIRVCITYTYKGPLSSSNISKCLLMNCPVVKHHIHIFIFMVYILFKRNQGYMTCT